MLFVYYPRCSTCQKAKKWLDEHDIEYEENQNSIIAKLDEDSIITIELDDNGLIKNVSTGLN